MELQRVRHDWALLQWEALFQLSQPVWKAYTNALVPLESSRFSTSGLESPSKSPPIFPILSLPLLERREDGGGEALSLCGKYSAVSHWSHQTWCKNWQDTGLELRRLCPSLACEAMWLQARHWPLLGHRFFICKMQVLGQPICRGLSPQV